MPESNTRPISKIPILQAVQNIGNALHVQKSGIHYTRAPYMSINLKGSPYQKKKIVRLDTNWTDFNQFLVR
ncbi:hypothetical protein [Bacillus cereus]|uniref:hypothetical protein n=1 Tax=Bacillus cereus TaxID=1396 RepID=UPI001CC083DE|nr:hypothetical protein [Bacillus cereus]